MGADLARRLRAREGRAAFSPSHPHQRSRSFLVKDGRGRGSPAPRAADRRAPCPSQPCSTETPRSRRRAAGASPRGPPPGRPPAPATRSPAAAPKRMSTMRFYTQQVKARRGPPAPSPLLLALPRPPRLGVTRRREPDPRSPGGERRRTLRESGIQKRWACPLDAIPDPGACVALGAGVPRGLWGRRALPLAPPSGLRVAEAPARAGARGRLLGAAKLSNLLPACDGERPTLAFLQDVMDILLQYVVKSFDRSTKVIDFHYPNELLQEYNWELADQPQNLEEILMHCQTTLKYAIKTGHPRYFNQLSTGLDMVGLAADWLTSTANTNIIMYAVKMK
ncbi:hypothetical protein HPG69_012423 [Diceros bicornis minor]|uniref:glutamate decarboxylase n=1 Tax=Diceros bicornis minor TaxID=77932 RepID=A0A7J7FLM6_DICBM|nr:hypothetical protein HPG69_012423 [Diceros bicornis minor]